MKSSFTHLTKVDLSSRTWPVTIRQLSIHGNWGQISSHSLYMYSMFCRAFLTKSSQRPVTLYIQKYIQIYTYIVLHTNYIQSGRWINHCSTNCSKTHNTIPLMVPDEFKVILMTLAHCNPDFIWCVRWSIATHRWSRHRRNGRHGKADDVDQAVKIISHQNQR